MCLVSWLGDYDCGLLFACMQSVVFLCTWLLCVCSRMCVLECFYVCCCVCSKLNVHMQCTCVVECDVGVLQIDVVSCVCVCVCVCACACV